MEAIETSSSASDVLPSNPEIAPKGGGVGPASQLAAVFLCGALAFVVLYCTQPLLPLLAQVFHASESQVGTTISASTLGVAISALLLAIFGERLDRKRTIVISTVAVAVVTMLTATATDLVTLAVWRFLQGLLTPGIFTLTIAYVTEEWPAASVPRVMSVYVAGTVFGGLMGRLIGGVIAANWGWRPVFAVLGVVVLAGAGATQLWLRAGSPRPHHVATGSRLRPLISNLRSTSLVAIFVTGFCMLFTLVSLFSFITFYLAAPPFNLSTAELSYLFMVYIFGLLATLGVGTVLARIGLRTGILGAVALALTGVGLTLMHSLAVVGIGLAVASSGVFIAQVCANSFLREAAPPQARVSATAMYICSYYIGGTIGGVLPGVFWKMAGWPGCVGLIASVLVLAALMAFFGWHIPTRATDVISSTAETV